MEICETENIIPENVAFIGDDVNDMGIIQLAGFTACPIDAIDEVKNSVDLVLSKKGGEGVFREFSDLIIKGKSQSLL
jgi:YrbI family 3-deoxy-D-manno-octulosonate 8-phosphate phosphatase